MIIIEVRTKIGAADSKLNTTDDKWGCAGTFLGAQVTTTITSIRVAIITVFTGIQEAVTADHITTDIGTILIQTIDYIVEIIVGAVGTIQLCQAVAATKAIGVITVRSSVQIIIDTVIADFTGSNAKIEVTIRRPRIVGGENHVGGFVRFGGITDPRFFGRTEEIARRYTGRRRITVASHDIHHDIDAAIFGNSDGLPGHELDLEYGLRQIRYTVITAITFQIESVGEDRVEGGSREGIGKRNRQSVAAGIGTGNTDRIGITRQTERRTRGTILGHQVETAIGVCVSAG